nr:lipid-A-disaccharide synthase N-terminal domain-containing protein [Luteibacter sp.]
MAFGIAFSPWNLIGYAGAFFFTLRWIVQALATRKKSVVHIPTSFWWLSLCGSSLTLTYFILGKSDPVGIISNIFPMISALYSLKLHPTKPL